MSFLVPKKERREEEIVLPKKSPLRPLRVLSYNVNFGSFYGNSQPPPAALKVLEAIQEADADVVLLQETNDGWQNFLSPILKSKYKKQEWISPNPTNYLAAGSAILCNSSSSCRLLSVDLCPTSRFVDGSFFDQMVALVCWRGEREGREGGEREREKEREKEEEVGEREEEEEDVVEMYVRIVNVHLRPPLAMGSDGSGLWANASAYSRSGEIHKREVFHCLDHPLSMQPNQPIATMVVGDFNEGSGGAISALKEKEFKEVFSVPSSANSSPTTWQWDLWGPLSLWGSYDHIFFRPSELKAVDWIVFDKYLYASDHLPLLGLFLPSSH